MTNFQSEWWEAYIFGLLRCCGSMSVVGKHLGKTFLGHLPWEVSTIQTVLPRCWSSKDSSKTQLAPFTRTWSWRTHVANVVEKTQTTWALLRGCELKGKVKSSNLFWQSLFSFWSSAKVPESHFQPFPAYISDSLLLLQCLWSWLFRTRLFITEECEAGIKEEHVSRIRIYPGIRWVLFCHMQECILIEKLQPISIPHIFQELFVPPMNGHFLQP